MRADYIMDVGKDMTRLALATLNDTEINCSKDSEEPVAKQNSSGIEDQVVNVHSAEGTTDD